MKFANKPTPSIEIRNPETDEWMVRVWPDRTGFADAYEVTTATAIFWEALRKTMPSEFGTC